MWLIGLSLFLSFAAVSLSVFSFLSLSRKLEKSDVKPLLENASSDVSATITKRVREIEIEWENMYQKLLKLLGRAEKSRGLEAPKAADETPAPVLTRADILRRGRNNRV